MYLQRLPSGSWRVAVRHNGRRATATRQTRPEAQHAGAELLLELGATPKSSLITVGELVGSWLVSNVDRLSVTYSADASRVIDRLPTEFTDRRLSQVTPAVIEGLYRQLAREGLSAHRIGRVHAVLSSAFTLARRLEWATTNPFQAARRPAVKRATISPPTVAQVTTLIDAADDRFRLYLDLSASLGARRGEVVGLQWDDITDDAVVVRRSLAYAPTSGVVITEGKTGPKGHRVVAVPTGLIGALRTLRVAQVELALRSGMPSPVWVFSHDAGVTPWRPDFATREFSRLRRSCGVGDTVRLHDLRHYVATQLLAAGVPLSVVGDRLGQRQLSTTSDVYGHYVPAADRAASDILDNIRRAAREIRR